LHWLKKAKTLSEGHWIRQFKKGRFRVKDKDTTLFRITHTDQYEDFKFISLMVEAVLEDLEKKREVFAQLDSICKPDCIFATNTSAIPIMLLATSEKPERIGRFLGAHFFSPASVMKVVEVIPGLETEEGDSSFHDGLVQ
jgi:3-hydroxybutyryl-CoA dehydrogenase